MLKDVKQFELKVENYVGHFLVDHTTPLHIAKEMCFQVLKILGQIEDNYKAQQAAQAAEAPSAPAAETPAVTPSEQQ